MARRPFPPPAGPGPAVPVGGGVPVDPQTGERFGFLPRKAARRKIIIRRTLGLPWVLAALLAALLIAAAGTAFLLSDPGRPASRYADAGPLAAYPQGAVTPLRSGAGWVDRRTVLKVWLCATDGSANVLQADAQVARGHLYVDPARTTAVPGGPGPALPGCPRPRPISP